MVEATQCTEQHTIINNRDYTFQSRTVVLENGERHEEYRILIEGLELKPWTRGDLARHFGLS